MSEPAGYLRHKMQTVVPSKKKHGQVTSCVFNFLLMGLITHAIFFAEYIYMLPEIFSEYNITFLFIEKTGRKPYSIREHIIGIVMVSERDFDNVTCQWSYNVYAL